MPAVESWKRSLLALYAQLPRVSPVVELERQALLDAAREEVLAHLEAEGAPEEGGFQNPAVRVESEGGSEVVRFLVRGEAL
jgi:hypothetical protein